MKVNPVYLLFVIINFSFLFSFGQENLNLKSGKVMFESSAPLETIKASTSGIKGLINPEKRTFAVNINNGSFQGFNSPLQKEHFLESYIESAKYPYSSFKGKIIETIDFSKDGIYEVRAKGTLNIHGIEQERIIKVRLTIKNGILSAASEFSVLLADHQIAIPSIVFQKIADTIKVSFVATFEKAVQ